MGRGIGIRQLFMLRPWRAVRPAAAARASDREEAQTIAIFRKRVK